MPKIAKLSMQLECAYGDDELAEKRDALADATIAVGEVECRKSSAAKAFKEELDALYAKCGQLSRQIRARSEFRMTDCVIEMNKPNVGEKTTIRLDTGEMVKVEVMTDSERQEEIEFDIEANRNISSLIEDAHKPTDEPPEAAGATP